MRLVHYLEIENFKGFRDKQRIELDHPSVLIGPNNCGKTTALQAIALWSQGLKTWVDARGASHARDRTGAALNRLAIVAVPVQRTRFFWHQTRLRNANKDIPLVLTLGVEYQGKVEPVTLRFRNQGDELVYCTPDDSLRDQMDLLRYAASLDVALLYSMSGLETEEPRLQPGRIDVLLGQGQTAQVLRNLCLQVQEKSPDDWRQIADWMKRLFGVEMGTPRETMRGAVELLYRQGGVKDLDIALAGRGFLQMLLLLAYLYARPRSILLIDEPDAHLELLRQKQVYVLLRELAAKQGSQVVLVTHSEIVLGEALETNLTLLIDGRSDDLAAKQEIRTALLHYGAEHYVRARERGYVFYVEGGTDLDMLRALARCLKHPVAETWDERINAYYLQDNYPEQSVDSEIERVEGGFGLRPQEHFFALRRLLPDLRGLALQDNDGRGRQGGEAGGLTTLYWRRYEAENYFITPSLLSAYARRALPDRRAEVDATLNTLIQERVFAGRQKDRDDYLLAQDGAQRLIWEARTERLKLSDFAEEFFRRLAERSETPMLLRKGELHQLIEHVSSDAIDAEVNEKLDALQALFTGEARA